MEIIESQIDVKDPQFKANAAHNRQLAEELREHTRSWRGRAGAKSISSVSASRASCSCAIGSISCWMAVRRFWNYRRWRRTRCTTATRPARVSSPGSGG